MSEHQYTQQLTRTKTLSKGVVFDDVVDACGLSLWRTCRSLVLAISSCAFVVAFCIAFTPLSASAASYVLSPANGTYEVGETFQVRVMVNTEGDGVNTGDATITYDSDMLTAVSASGEGSAFNLWVTEPTVSGSSITFAGGGTKALAGTQPVATITFRGKKEGVGSVSFSKGTLLAGAGQDVLSGMGEATYTITPKTEAPVVTQPPTQQKTERKTNIPPPEQPRIDSETHPDESLWYSLSDVEFSWDAPFGVTSLKHGFGTTSTVELTELHEPPTSSWSASGLVDGTYYFRLAYQSRGGWSTTTTYTLRIDTTPPEPFEATAIGGDLTAQVRFEATDTLSGIAQYKISIDGERERDVQTNEIVGGGYTITSMDPGLHSIAVTAIDNAGNERVATTDVEVTGEKPLDEEEVETSGFGAIYWVSLLFMAALAVVITMLIQERRKHTEERDRIKREAAEAGDKLINIFGVLRDEVEEKIVSLSHKPNMTDNERNILEGLKDALDISEELIDKELEDVRKLLK